MRLPRLSSVLQRRESINVFGGYDHNPRTAAGSFYGMENLTGEHFPVLSPRAARQKYVSAADFGGMISKRVLCYVDGTELVVGSSRVEMGLSKGKKMLVSMGAYIIIMPDRKYINTENLSDLGDIDNSVTSDTGAVFTLCREDGSTLDNIVPSREPLINMTESLCWLDMSHEPYELMQYYAAQGMWMPIKTYVKIYAEGIGKGFSQGDGVVIGGTEDGVLAGVSGNHTVVRAGLDYLIVDGFFVPDGISENTVITALVSVSVPVTVSRKMPMMDHITERGNRLWGCRYGKSANGEPVNEIYVSKAGDFKNWNSFSGSSSDSYVMSVGSDGEFTGAFAYGDCTVFFKEDCIHKVYGQFPSEFRSVDTVCEGVELGSSGSIASVGGVLYYKSRSGIMAYNGSLPVSVSSALGSSDFKNAVAVSHEGRYYVSMEGDGGGIFVYTPERGFWHRQDGKAADGLASHGGSLYVALDGVIQTSGEGEPFEEKVHWMCESGLIGTDSPERLYISRLSVRLKLDAGALAVFSVEYDSSGVWERVGAVNGTALASFNVPIRTKRCDHLRLRIDGEGDAKIFGIQKTLEEGSDIL